MTTAAAAAIVGFILSAPVTIPLAGVSHARLRRRQRRAALSTACGYCGETLGQAALDAADLAWVNRVAQLQSNLALMRYRIVRSIYAICPHCGTAYGFNESKRQFLSLEERGSAAQM